MSDGRKVGSFRIAYNLSRIGKPYSAMRTGYNCAHPWRLPREPNSGRTRSYRH